MRIYISSLRRRNHQTLNSDSSWLELIVIECCLRPSTRGWSKLDDSLEICDAYITGFNAQYQRNFKLSMRNMGKHCLENNYLLNRLSSRII